MKNASAFENPKPDLRSLKPGLYIARLDRFGLGMFTTLDLRFVSPNSELESPLPSAALHTIEHLGSIYLFERCPERLSAVSFAPRGSRTGFRAIMYGSYEVERYCDLFIRMANFIIDWNAEIPDATPDCCGDYRDHNLLAAKSAMIKWRAVLESRDLDYDQFHYPE